VCMRTCSNVHVYLQVCKECFYRLFEEEIHETIMREKMFKRGETVCVAASGGKDSTVLAEVCVRE